MRAALTNLRAMRGLVLAGLVLLSPFTLMGQDVEGSADHPLVSRFEGSTITRYRSVGFDEYRLVNAPITGYRGGESVPASNAIGDENSIRLEGRVTTITYEAPDNSSTLQILRSYQGPLESAGFETIFTCTNRACAGEEPRFESRFSAAIMTRVGLRLSGTIYDNQRYLAARLRRPEGDVYVSLLVIQLRQPLAQLDIIEVEPLEEGLVTVDAATMARDIETTGSVALYGIHFDTNMAEVRPDSEPVLQQISRLLEQSPALRLLVVGHTDNTGTFERNLALSDERARAVVDALVSRYGIDGDRLTGHGVGSLAPVAPNTSEDGRAQNRRVVLVAR